MSNTPPLPPEHVDALDATQLAALIDHTLLGPTASAQDIDALCDQAITYGTASVCIQPIWVERATQRLHKSAVKVCTVIGFPTGAQTPETKAFETDQAIRLGADEVDMVIDQAAALANDQPKLLADISAVVEAAKNRGVLVKVILETAALTDHAKIIACETAAEAGAQYVKTSTGFGPGGATIADVALLRKAVGDQLGVKAAGGIRTRQDALDMLKAGATRIGASSTYAIVS